MMNYFIRPLQFFSFIIYFQVLHTAGHFEKEIHSVVVRNRLVEGVEDDYKLHMDCNFEVEVVDLYFDYNLAVHY
jgi:hypothetical protein